MSLLYSEQELQSFIDKLPPLAGEEAWFTSLSTRNKYLNAEERTFYNIGSAEMFARELIFESDLNNFKFIIEVLDHQLMYRKTRAGELFPAHATTIYFNINPVSGIKAFFLFQTEMLKETETLMHGIQSGNDVEVNRHRFKNCQSILRTCFQKALSRKAFIDIDFDVKQLTPSTYWSVITDFKEFCIKNSIKHFIIETKSGYHAILYCGTIKVNLKEEVTRVNNFVQSISEGEKKGEVVINKNGMVPLPGTLQAGFKVRII